MILMELTHHRIDIARALEDSEIVHDVVPRRAKEVWMVLSDAIRFDAPLVWHVCQREQHVMIPLVPYWTSEEPDLAMAFMLQLGLRCAGELATPIRRLHIATGYPVSVVETTDGPRLQYYAGFGVVLDNGR